MMPGEKREPAARPLTVKAIFAGGNERQHLTPGFIPEVVMIASAPSNVSFWIYSLNIKYKQQLGSSKKDVGSLKFMPPLYHQAHCKVENASFL